MAEIVLATVNARYAHTAFGLRYLVANLGALASRTLIVELDGRQAPATLAAELLRHAPTIVGLGVYIWNVARLTEVARALKAARPELLLVLGGPEVSFETEGQPIVALADFVITGEADLELAPLAAALLEGRRPASKVIRAALPDLGARAGGVRLPYALYTDEDLTRRVIYVETSRGCAFGCDFCLSAVRPGVRRFPLAAFFVAVERLLARGARRFKFVDRTFNLDEARATAVLEFFLDRLVPGLSLHFELVPDRLPGGMRDLLGRFPDGVLHLEVGVQSLNEGVVATINRRQSAAVTEANLRFLRCETGARLHVDLILGLPGEELASIAHSFDRLVALRPHELQVGILKRLRGAPIARHDEPFAMVYQPEPPYEVVATSTLAPELVTRLKRFARFWDILSHAGFDASRAALWRDGSPFDAFMSLSDWLFARCGRTHGLPLTQVAELLAEYLATQGGCAREEAMALVVADYQRPGRHDWPRRRASRTTKNPM